MRPDESIESYRSAVPDGNERHRIAGAVERIGGGADGSGDYPGGRAATLQAGRRTSAKRPGQDCHWNRSERHYAKETAHRGR
jgi:hypothetical protein